MKGLTALGRNRTTNPGYSTHRILLGTHTSGQDQNYLQIAQVQIPLADEELDQTKYDDDKGGELQLAGEAVLASCA